MHRTLSFPSRKGTIMGSDAIVSRGQATVDGHSLFGQNLHGQTTSSVSLCLTHGRDFVLGELAGTPRVKVPQVRHTYTVLGVRPGDSWGYRVGLNSEQVAAGCVSLLARRRDHKQPGLTGPELVRLILERSHCARQAVDILTDLMNRHGQGGHVGGSGEAGRDHAFLVTDPGDAYLVETAGSHWAVQEIREVRAVASLRTIRQDWDRIAHAFVEEAIESGSWPEDGSKLDFAGALGEGPAHNPSAMRRWARGMLLLQEQNGHIDLGATRRVLRDHGGESEEGPWTPTQVYAAGSICRHPGALPITPSATQLSFVSCLRNQERAVPLAWVAFGPPCLSVYFPVFLTGELPTLLVSTGPDSVAAQLQKLQSVDNTPAEGSADLRELLDKLQADFDQWTEEYLQMALAAPTPPRSVELEHPEQALMRKCLDRFESLINPRFDPRLSYAPALPG